MLPRLAPLAILLLCQLLGELLHLALHLPIPGAVLGMLLLALAYGLRRREPSEPMRSTANGLLGILGLLFVPAGVGIVTQTSLLRSAWLPLLAGLVGSTCVTLLVTAGIMHLFARRQA